MFLNSLIGVGTDAEKLEAAVREQRPDLFRDEPDVMMKLVVSSVPLSVPLLALPFTSHLPTDCPLPFLLL